MLDRLLGNKDLEERIQALEVQVELLKSEKQSLLARQASKDETARKAVSQKQVVEEELNTAKKKIETLEHEILTLRKDAVREVTFQNITNIYKMTLESYLFQVSSIQTKDSNLVTVYLRPGDSLSNLERYNELQERLGIEKAALIDKINSPTGAVVFYDIRGMVREAVALYLPVETSSWKLDNNFKSMHMQEIVERVVNFGVIIAHAGESFIGFSNSPESLNAHKIIRSSVKGKHTKGGWSQRRFERLRDEDVQHHVEKVKEAMMLMIQEQDDRIDFIVAGGDFKLVHEILKNIDIPIINRKFDVSVDKKNLDGILKELWSSKRYII